MIDSSSDESIAVVLHKELVNLRNRVKIIEGDYLQDIDKRLCVIELLIQDIAWPSIPEDDEME